MTLGLINKNIKYNDNKYFNYLYFSYVYLHFDIFHIYKYISNLFVCIQAGESITEKSKHLGRELLKRIYRATL